MNTTSDSPVTVLNLELTPELRQEGIAREIIRNVQQARKQADFQVDDRIILYIQSPSEVVTEVLQNSSLTDLIKQETLATQVREFTPEETGFNKTVQVDGHEVALRLVKT